jgi:hypothetical protein
MSRRYWGFGPGLGLALVASGAQAVPIGQSSAEIHLLFAGVSEGQAAGASVIGGAFETDAAAEASPGGAAESRLSLDPEGRPIPLSAGDAVSLHVEASARAVGPAGLSDAFVLSDGFVTATNETALTIDLEFLVSFEVATDATVADPGLEIADAFAAVSLASASGGLLFGVAAEADSAFGPVSDELAAALLPFSLSLDPFGTDTLSLTADAEATAASVAPPPGVSPIPGPSPLVLLLTGLCAIASCRRPSERDGETFYALRGG